MPRSKCCFAFARREDVVKMSVVVREVDRRSDSDGEHVRHERVLALVDDGMRRVRRGRNCRSIDHDDGVSDRKCEQRDDVDRWTDVRDGHLAVRAGAGPPGAALQRACARSHRAAAVVCVRAGDRRSAHKERA
jgi:hypothetical protein